MTDTFKTATKQPHAFAAQMDDIASKTDDPVAAMTMRVASDILALLPKHANYVDSLAILMQALPNILTSIAESVSATAYRGDADQTRHATLVILRHALKSYELANVRRVHEVKPS